MEWEVSFRSFNRSGVHLKVKDQNDAKKYKQVERRINDPLLYFTFIFIPKASGMGYGEPS